MMNDLLIGSACAALGIGLSAIFSGLETGLYTINRVRLAVRASHDDLRAQRVSRELADQNRMLSTLLLGNNIANYLGTFGIAMLLAVAGFSDWSIIWLQALILTPVLFIFGETLPKDLFRTHTDHWTYSLSWLTVIARRLFTGCGLLFVINGFGAMVVHFTRATSRVTASSRQTISLLIKEGVGSGVLSEAQTSLVDRALALRDRSVKDEVIPWSRVVHVRDDQDRSVWLDVARQHNYTRLPVVSADGRVVGIVSTQDIMLDQNGLNDDAVSDVLSFEPDMPVRQALQRMRKKKCAMAIVCTADSSTPLGLVTLKDLIEPLTGELAAW